MQPPVYVNVDTQTSFSSTDDDTSSRDCQRRPNTDNSNLHLETIQERLPDRHDDAAEGEDEDEDEDGDDDDQPERARTTHYRQRCESRPREAANPNGQPDSANQLEQQLTVLRDLLRIERQKNQQRKLNNNSMQQYLAQLQSDYLSLQRELVETLELGHKMKTQKEAQINALDETLKDKDKLIEQLRDNLSNLDDSKVRAEFKQLMEKQSKMDRLEKDQLREQIENAEQQLVRERVNNSQILQQFQSKLEEQMNLHDTETASLKKKLHMLEADYEKLLKEPQNLMIKNLKEEKSRLSCQLDELSFVLNESHSKYDALRKRIEELLTEHEQMESNNRAEIERLQQDCLEHRRAHNQVKAELEDRDELVQLVQFNLHRSEKRVKNLLNAMKGKEQTYGELISQMNVKHEQELDRLTSEFRSIERKLIDSQSELDKKQNEVMKLELERENQLDSIRNDRDERLVKLNHEKQKLENTLKALELKFAHELEDKENKSKLAEQYQKELQYFREESKRLSLELTKAEARLFIKQKEISNLSESRDDLLQNDTKEQFEDVKLELDEAKRHSKRLVETIELLKTENGKLRMKLKVNESYLAKVNATIGKEQAKMFHDYESRMDQLFRYIIKVSRH